MNDDDERSWTLYYGFGKMELWLSREYFFWRIMKILRILLLATSESLQAAIKQGWNWDSAFKSSVKSFFRVVTTSTSAFCI